jgi:ADP-heptose:LPS heptosyltransferase
MSARKPAQRWPVENFASLARQLHAEHGARLLLFWSPGPSDDPRHPGDDARAAELLDRCQGIPIQPMPTAHLEELIAGLSLCDQLVCSDGGAMHLAAGLGKPMVCFFGNSQASRWRPWGVPHRLLQPASENVADVSVDQALRAYATLVSAGE